MIEIQNLNITYKKRKIIQDASFTIPEGKITMLIGLSGSGKTSVLYRLGMITEDASFVYKIDGKNINHLTISDRQIFATNNIGYVLQTKNLVEYTVKRNIEYTYQMIGQKVTNEQILKNLKQFQLENEINQDIRQLSEGQKQRLAILCAMIKKPRILILDEPTSALDEENATIIFNILKQLRDQGMTIILTSHQLEYLKDADCIYEIANQQVILKKACNEEKIDVIDNKKRISFSSLIYYLISFTKRYKWRTLTILMLFSLLFTSLLFAIGYNETLTNKTMNQFLTEYSTQQIYVETNDQQIDFNQDERIYSWYPYYEIKVYDTDILPLYEESYLNNEIILDTTTRHQKGNYADFVNFDTLIHDYIYIEEINYYLRLHGCFKKSVKNLYNDNDNSFFVYAAKEEYEQIASQLDLSPKGYTIFLKDYKQKQEVMDDYGFTNYYEQTSNQEIIDELQATISSSKENTVLIISTLAFVGLFVSLYRYFSKRKEEFVIMMINGLKRRKISQLLLIENLVHILIAVTLSSLSFFGIYQLLLHLNIQLTPLSTGYVFELLFTLSIIVLILIQLFYWISLYFLNKEKVLRG